MASTLGAHLLKKWRAARKLSQVDAATHLGIPQARLSHYEKGRRTPGLKIAFRIQERSESEIPAASWAMPGPDESPHPEAKAS